MKRDVNVQGRFSVVVRSVLHSDELRTYIGMVAFRLGRVVIVRLGWGGLRQASSLTILPGKLLPCDRLWCRVRTIVLLFFGVWFSFRLTWGLRTAVRALNVLVIVSGVRPGSTTLFVFIWTACARLVIRLTSMVAVVSVTLGTPRRLVS